MILPFLRCPASSTLTILTPFLIPYLWKTKFSAVNMRTKYNLKKDELRTQIFWDVMLCHWVSGSKHFEGTHSTTKHHIPNIWIACNTTVRTSYLATNYEVLFHQWHWYLRDHSWKQNACSSVTLKHRLVWGCIFNQFHNYITSITITTTW
jgi:hypothetical protein